MVDKNNIILGLESSMNDNEIGDEDIVIDYQEEEEDHEKNYTDTEHVNVEDKDDSKDDENMLGTTVLDGDTKQGEVILGEIFGDTSDFK